MGCAPYYSASDNYFGMRSRKELLSVPVDDCKRRRSDIDVHSRIQIMSALILLLIQSCVTMPLPTIMRRMDRDPVTTKQYNSTQSHLVF